MKFVYTTAIRKIRKMEKRIKIVPGGTSAGKTFAILPILVDIATKRPGTSISIVSESYPHLRRGAMRDFFNIMQATGRWFRDHWKAGSSTYRFGNGSYIEFFSVQSGDKLRGARRDVLYINECNNVSQDAYNQLAMRTNEEIFLDYNPTHKFWITDVMKSEESEICRLTYKDNEALHPNIIGFLEEKRELAKTSERWTNWCKVYLDGEEGRLEGVIFQDWQPIDRVPLGAELIGYGMDFGFSQDPTTAIAVYRWDGKLVLDQFIYQKGLLNSEIAKHIKAADMDRVEGWADSAEPKTIAELRKWGCKVNPVKKGSIVEGLNLLLEYDFLVTKRSTDLIGELESYQWKVDAEGNAMNVPIGPDHAIDAVRYLAIMKLGHNRQDHQQRFVIV